MAVFFANPLSLHCITAKFFSLNGLLKIAAAKTEVQYG